MHFLIGFLIIIVAITVFVAIMVQLVSFIANLCADIRGFFPESDNTKPKWFHTYQRREQLRRQKLGYDK